MLATPEDLASFLQQDLDTATATLALEGATAIVQAAAGQRILEVVGDVVVLDVDEHDYGPWLDLPEGPVSAVATVLVGATAVTDYMAQLRRGRLYRSLGWRAANLGTWQAPSTVTVTYTHGLPVGDYRLELARTYALVLAGTGYGNPAGATRERIDDYDVQYDAMAARMEANPTMKAALRRMYGRTSRSTLLI